MIRSPYCGASKITETLLPPGHAPVYFKLKCIVVEEAGAGRAVPRA